MKNVKQQKKEQNIIIFLIIYTISFFFVVLFSFLICHTREKTLMSFCPGELSIRLQDEQRRIVFSRIDKLGKKNIKKFPDEIV